MIRLTTLLLLTASFAVFAQPTPPPKPCNTSDYRDFDFWLGDWKVTSTNADGEQILAGHNTISKIEGGCILHEQWRGQGGTTGQSLNGYDKNRDVWQQTWMDNQGTVLTMIGGMQGTDMVLGGKGPALDGSDTQWAHEIRWHPDAESGDVTQTWRAKSDDDAEWRVLFTGLYQRSN